MKRIWLVGLTLIAAIAIGAISSTAASAVLPEFLPEKGVKLEGTFGKRVMESLGGTKVECSGGTITGEVTGAKTISKAKIIFKGCKTSSFSCNTAKAAPGELVSNELTGTLGYISKASKTVGILLKAVSKLFWEFDCVGGIVKNKALGAVICPIEKVNSDTSKLTLKCEEEKGDQKPTKFEGGETAVLLISINGGAEEDWGEQATAEVSSSALVEMMA